MYVRWRKRELTRTTAFRGRARNGGDAVTAVLVESSRVAGRARQRFVAHLATVRVWDDATGMGDVSIDGGGRARLGDVRRFWADVSRKLDALAVAFDRQVVEARIAARVPRPPAGHRSAGRSSSASRAAALSGSVASARR